MHDVDELAGHDVAVARRNRLARGGHLAELGRRRRAADDVDHRNLTNVDRLLASVVAEIEVAVDEVGGIAAMADELTAFALPVGQNERRAFRSERKSVV